MENNNQNLTVWQKLAKTFGPNGTLGQDQPDYKLDKKELLKTLKILPDNINGNINLIELPNSFNNAANQIHPLIIYADLIASFDSRNIETAQKIYKN